MKAVFASPVKTAPKSEPFSLRKVMRFSTAMKPNQQQTQPMKGHEGDIDEY